MVCNPITTLLLVLLAGPAPAYTLSGPIRYKQMAILFSYRRLYRGNRLITFYYDASHNRHRGYPPNPFFIISNLKFYIGRILPAFAITSILAQLPSLALGASFQDLSTQTAIRCKCNIVHVEQMVPLACSTTQSLSGARF